ncbi:uncharacterized membrane protein (DUF485 family) [Croceifilum oryzae]|uniref:Uncharacterized membrane protein (DUF485 family) n=1 Tax=Croceifilum oryzae TaxID=1553429 RepID=A0AAJ1TJ21_9BACL|nr:DUF485 domain-containing protein [Croceifilum oryzae]MDQ0417021.1 uncharacterized membrane protein (DUF485 family) [Croceifilum oryzae]
MEPRQSYQWAQIARSSEFIKLMKKRKKFQIFSAIFFVLYYFALPVLAGYTDLLNKSVFGSINGIYLFALSQFFMAWILAFIYVRHANQLDQTIEQIKKDLSKEGLS